jgi:hypothetical protein
VNHPMIVRYSGSRQFVGAALLDPSPSDIPPEYRVVATRRITPSAALGNGNHTREQTSQLSQRHRLRITTVRLTAARGSPTETSYWRTSKRKNGGTGRRRNLD